MTIGGLHDALDRVEGKQPTQRLLAAIAPKRGLRRPNVQNELIRAAERSITGFSDSISTNYSQRRFQYSSIIEEAKAIRKQ
jgi:hypothetical protein